MRRWFASGEAASEVAVRVMQVGIVGLLVVGLAWRNVSLVVNTVLALGVTVLPAILTRNLGLTLSPALTLWLTSALFLHAIGMAGPYGTVWWWDHMTHTFSGSFVAGVGYSTARAIDIYSEDVHLPNRFLFVFVFFFALAAGVLWEVLEFVGRHAASAVGQDPVLIQYGLDDTILDLVFDAVGAVLVALFATPLLADLVDSVVGRLQSTPP